MTTINRKIKRGTLGYRNNPKIKYYNSLYNIGIGLIGKILITFGESEYSHNFCKFIVNKKSNESISNYTFDELVREFETGSKNPIIENKINNDEQ